MTYRDLCISLVKCEFCGSGTYLGRETYQVKSNNRDTLWNVTTGMLLEDRSLLGKEVEHFKGKEVEKFQFQRRFTEG